MSLHRSQQCNISEMDYVVFGITPQEYVPAPKAGRKETKKAEVTVWRRVDSTVFQRVATSAGCWVDSKEKS